MSQLIEEADVTAVNLLAQARALVVKHQKPSVGFLQRHLKIGFNRATAVMRCLEGDLVTAPDGGHRANVARRSALRSVPMTDL